MGDTPGFIYGLSYVISAYIFCNTNPRRKRSITTHFKQLLWAAFIIFFMIITKNVPKIFFLIFVFMEFCMVCFLIYMGCSMNVRNAIYYGVRAYVLGEFAASLEWQLFYYAINNYGMPLNTFTQTVSIIVTFGAIYLLAYMIERLINSDGVHLHVERQEVIAAFAIGVLIYAFSNLSYLGIATPFTTMSTFELFIIRTLVDAAGIALLGFYHVLLKESHARIEATQMETLLQMQYSNYQVTRESMDLVNQKYHDLKHQINILRKQTDDDKQQYLDQMEREIKEYEAQNKTGNETLDTVLTSKKLICQSEDIKLTAVADGEAISFMNIMDISNLFGNALDNAIEACEKIENKEERLIHLAVARERAFLKISVENRFDGELKVKNGTPQTTKTDNRYHGFGVKSIRSVAEKYNGSMTISAEDGWFRLRVLIPL